MKSLANLKHLIPEIKGHIAKAEFEQSFKKINKILDALLKESLHVFLDEGIQLQRESDHLYFQYEHHIKNKERLPDEGYEYHVQHKKISSGLLYFVNEIKKKIDGLDSIRKREAAAEKKDSLDGVLENFGSDGAPIVKAQIPGVIEELNNQDVKPKINASDLFGFGDSEQDLIRFMTSYSVLKSTDDLKRILSWRLQKSKGTPPLCSELEVQATPLYQAIFDQDTVPPGKDNKGLNIVLFRRGRMGKKLTNLLRTIPGVKIQVIVSATDDGESWFDISRAFGAYGIPGAAKTLLDLSTNKPVKDFLETRFEYPQEQNDEKAISNIKSLLQFDLESPGSDAKVHKMEDSMKKVCYPIYNQAMRLRETDRQKLASFFKAFVKAFEEKVKVYSELSFRNLSLRNIALLGAALEFKMEEENKEGSGYWQKAIDELAKILEIRQGSRVILPTQKRQRLIGVEESKTGVVYFSEVPLNYYAGKGQLSGLWLVPDEYSENQPDKAPKDKMSEIMENLAKEGVALYPIREDDEQFREMVKYLEVIKPNKLDRIKDQVKATTRKIDIGPDFEKLIELLDDSYSEKKKKEDEKLTQEAKDAIKAADIIIYTCKKLETNIGGALITPGMAAAIENAPSALKIVLSTEEEFEGTAFYSKSFNENIEDLYRYVSNNMRYKTRYKTKKINWGNAGNFFDYVILGHSGMGKLKDIKRQIDIFENETDGEITGVSLHTPKNWDYNIFPDSVIRNAILSLYKLQKLNFKIGNGGALLPWNYAKTRWDMAPIGMFRKAEQVESLINKLRKTLSDLSFEKQGALVFDVDMTGAAPF
ncbi:MAG: YvcK family protein [Lewinellaceae bacterium]|nr:YvcK family protein [Lewinellaceae bacterium]